MAAISLLVSLGVERADAATPSTGQAPNHAAAKAQYPAPKTVLCHRTGNAENPFVTIVVEEAAVAEHRRHGDKAGACAKGAVLGAGSSLAAVTPAAGSRLPFTGLAIGGVAALGLLFGAAGLGLRRAARRRRT